MSDIVMKVTIPKGTFCKECGFLTDVPEGYCFLYGYLKHYNNEEKSYEKSIVCKMDYPDGKVILVVEGDSNGNL